MKKFLICLALIASFAVNADAQRGSSSSSRGSSGGFSSSSSRGGGFSSSSGSSRGSSSGSSSRPSSSGSSSGGFSSKSSAPKSNFSSGGTTSSGSRKSSTSYDSGASSAAAKQQSKQNFTAASAPKSSYTTPKGTTVKVDPKDKTITSLRSSLSQQKYENRQLRQNNFYASYRSYPVVHYNDRYNPYLNAWLATQTVDVMANWLYHHRATMDAARYQSMIASNAGLQARVASLEAGRVPVNTAYVPPGVDEDLLYGDSYVDAAYNPQAVQTPFGTFLGFLYAVFVVAIVAAAAIIVIKVLAGD